MQISDSAPGSSVLENDGTISVVGNAASPSAVALAITGQGSIQLGAYGLIQFGSNVAGSQLIQFNGGSGQYEPVAFGRPGPIAATITGLTAGTLTIFTGSVQTALNVSTTASESQYGNLLPGLSSMTRPIYRFFETKFGTQFFTASTAERDTIITNRSDLAYEPASPFYEQMTVQPGDVAVHRLFETGTGTRYCAGSQAEFQILTPLPWWRRLPQRSRLI